MMKKNAVSVLAGAIALLVGSQAFAAPPVAELKVVGTLEVPGCEVNAGDSTVVYDFGDITPDKIKPGTATSTLDPIDKDWTIVCTGRTYLTFGITDERSGSESSKATTNFGMGFVNDEKPIGYYQVAMSGAKTSAEGGEPANAKVFATTTTTFTAVDSVILQSNAKMGWASATNVLAAADTFSANLKVTPTLAGTTTMGGPITEDTSLDGLLTLNFSFGLQ